MKKLIYIIRKIFGIITFIFFILVFITTFIVPSSRNNLSQYQYIMSIMLLILVFAGFYIYPFRDRYCSCGRKYTSKKYEYIEAQAGKSKTKNNIKTTNFQYKINVVNHCEHCNKDHINIKNIYGGEIIEDLNNGTYEDKRIPYDEAINAFKESEEKKKK